VHGHLLAATQIIHIAVALIDELVDAEATPYQNTRLAVLSIDEIPAKLKAAWASPSEAAPSPK